MMKDNFFISETQPDAPVTSPLWYKLKRGDIGELLELTQNGYEKVIPSNLYDAAVEAGYDGTLQEFINGLANMITFDENNDVVLREKSKILGTNENQQQYELIGLGEYTINDANYDQVEVGSESIHLNLNTNNDTTYGDHITVDTPNGKKLIAYKGDAVINKSEVLSVSSWILVDNLYTYQITDSDIVDGSYVPVTIQNDSVEIAANAQLQAMPGYFPGGMTIFAVNIPTADINISYSIIY